MMMAILSSAVNQIYALVKRYAVNFINVKRANFTYESLFGSIFYLHVTREKLQKRRSYEKCVHLTLMKLTHGVMQCHIFFLKSIFCPKL